MITKREDASRGLTREELLALPAAVDLETANRALSLSRTTGYDLAKRGRYPCTVLRLGTQDSPWIPVLTITASPKRPCTCSAASAVGGSATGWDQARERSGTLRRRCARCGALEGERQ